MTNLISDARTVLVGLIIQALVFAGGYGALLEKVSRNTENIEVNERKIEQRVNSNQDLRERMIRVETLLETISAQVNGIKRDLSKRYPVEDLNERNPGFNGEFNDESTSESLDSTRNPR